MTPHRGAPATREDLMLALVVAVLLVFLWAIRSVVMLVAFALLLAYVLEPLVALLERIPIWRGRRLPRAFGAFLILAALGGSVGWLVVISTPLLVNEFTGFLGRLPGMMESFIAYVRLRVAATGPNPRLDQALEALQLNSMSFLPQVAGAALKWVGAVFSRAEQILGLAVLPILVFYLLADRHRVRESMLRLMPADRRENLIATGPAIDRALKSYVRGQALVCLTQGVGTGAMLAMAGVPNALFLGVLAGFGEVLPLVGAMIATIAILLSGFSLDWWHGLAGVAIYMTNNWLLGTFITPRVMERYLEIHPFAVIVSVLAGGHLLGPPGAILALPVAAVTQALVEERGRRERG
jgi:predicted PurR-regulated permease PerM